MVAQFVPIKLDVASDEFRDWERAHPSEGRSIPIIYIVRADGETLYAKSGSLGGDALPELLVQVLESSGRVLNESEVNKIADVTAEFKEQKTADNIPGAIKALNKLKRIGNPGEIPSYAASAVELNQLVVELAETYHAELVKLDEMLKGDVEQDKLLSMMKFLELRRKLTGFKLLKEDFAAFQKQMSRGKELRQLSREAKIIDAAIIAKSPSSQTRTRTKLRELIDSTEIPSVKEYATETLKKIEGS